MHRLAADNVTTQTAEDEQLGSAQALLQSIRNWRTWLMVVGYMVRTPDVSASTATGNRSTNSPRKSQVIVGSSTLSYFYPTLVAGLGYTSHMAQYMVRQPFPPPPHAQLHPTDTPSRSCPSTPSPSSSSAYPPTSSTSTRITAASSSPAGWPSQPRHPSP